MVLHHAVHSQWREVGKRPGGEEKTFREGQKKQTLDDLFFIFLDTVEKLKPKIVVAENVTGLIKGNAKGYVNEIIKRFHEFGYDVQLFRLNAAKMNVPQARERVFFIANNQGYPKLQLNFNEKPILFGECRSEKGRPYNGKYVKDLKYYRKGDKCISDIKQRTENRISGFNNTICADDEVHPTLPASAVQFRAFDKMLLSDDDCRNISTFPQDYDFGKESAKYICGMSVPPNMMANIASEIWTQWLSK